MNRHFPPGDRTYHISDERLRAFRALTTEEKLCWLEELSAFLRLAKVGKRENEGDDMDDAVPR